MKAKAIGMLILGVALVISTCAWNREQPPSQEPRLITVTGDAEVRVVPDEVILTLGVETLDKDLGVAKTWTGALGSAKSMAELIGPAGNTHAGAWTSLIVAEGKIFGWSFRPSGPLTEIVHKGTRVKIFPKAEDFMVAIDVNTGRTVWKAVEPKGMVWGVGKRKGHMVSPAYLAGTFLCSNGVK